MDSQMISSSLKETLKEFVETPNRLEAPQSPSSLATELDDDWVTLNVGGQLITTTRSVLTSDPESVLARMFDPGSPFKLSKDLSHRLHPFLLDRDPRYFTPILNFLRNRELVIDPNVNVKGVLTEARYFGVQAVVDMLTPMCEEMDKKESDGDGSSEKPVCELSRSDIVHALIRSESGARLRFQGLQLHGIDLSGLDLSGVNMSKTILNGAQLSNCCLDRAELKGSSFDGANMSNIMARNCALSRSTLRNAVLSNALLNSSDLSHCDLTECDLSGADLSGANLSGCCMRNANLTGANLKGALLKNAILDGVNRHGANLSMGGVLFS